MASPLLACTLIYHMFGISSIVVSQVCRTPCGLSGSPPLSIWVFGTGISYLIIGICHGIVGIFMMCSIAPIVPRIIIISFCNAFVFAWMIVGAVSLWQHGGECETINYSLWAMGMGDVIVSFITFFLAIFVYNEVSEHKLEMFFT